MREKATMILGLRIGRFHSGRRRRRKVPSALDRITSAALLDAAVKDPEVLAQIIDKYGEIQVRHDDMIATEAENIRVKVYREAAQTILNSRRQELTSRVNGIIDRVMGLNTLPGGRQHEERSFEGATPGEQNGTPDMARRRHGRQSSLETNSNPSVLIGGLAMLALLNKIVHQQRKEQTEGSLEE